MVHADPHHMCTQVRPRRYLYSAVLAAVLVLSLFGIRTQLEVLCPLDGLHALGLALGALKLQHNLLRRLGLLLEDGLGLAAVARLLLVVTALALCAQGGLASLVLRNLVGGVLLALA